MGQKDSAEGHADDEGAIVEFVLLCRVISPEVFVLFWNWYCIDNTGEWKFTHSIWLIIGVDHIARFGVFIAAVKAASFAGAAQALGISSSAVSKQIQTLEQDLQVKLLNRTTRNVSPTEEGALYFERAARALEDLKEAEGEINELKSHPCGPHEWR